MKKTGGGPRSSGRGPAPAASDADPLAETGKTGNARTLRQLAAALRRLIPPRLPDTRTADPPPASRTGDGRGKGPPRRGR